MSTTSAPCPLRRVALVTVTAILWAVPAVAAEQVPGTVLPGAADGTDVVLVPAALRAEDGRAELDLEVGSRAPGDVVVELALAHPDRADDGTVTPGGRAGGRISPGARLRPGERLRVEVAGVSSTTLVVATVHPTGDGDPAAPDASQQVAALVLPGPAGPPPEATITVTDDQLRGTVTVATPTLVTARLVGAEAITYPDRLVVPDEPLVLTGVPAAWPGPSELAVTDDAGRSVTVDTGRRALVVIAGGLVLVAILLGLLVVRARRRHAAGPLVE